MAPPPPKPNFFMRTLYALGRFLAWPFKKFYRYFKPLKPFNFNRSKDQENHRSSDESVNSTLQNSTSDHNNTTAQSSAQSSTSQTKHQSNANLTAQQQLIEALSKMVVNSLQRKVKSIDSVSDGLLTLMVKPILRLIIGQQVSMDSLSEEVQISLINDENVLGFFSDKLKNGESLWKNNDHIDGNPLVTLAPHFILFALVYLEKALPHLQKLISSEVSVLPLQEKPKAIGINKAIDRYLEAVEKVLFDQLQNITIEQKRKFKLDFVSPGFIIETTEKSHAYLRSFMWEVPHDISGTYSFRKIPYLLQESDCIHVELHEHTISPIFLVRENLRRQLRILDGMILQVNQLLIDSKSTAVIQELQDLVEADTFLRIIHASDPKHSFQDVNPQWLGTELFHTDESAMMRATDYYIYRILHIRAFLSGLEPANTSDEFAAKKGTLLKKVLKFAKDGADAITDKLDDAAEVTGFNTAKRYASAKSFLESHLIACIPAERIPKLLEHCDAKFYIDALFELPQEHLRSILCGAIPSFKALTTSKTTKDKLLGFIHDKKYQFAVLEARGKGASNAALWSLLEKMDPHKLAEFLSLQYEDLHLRFLNHFAKFKTLRDTRSVFTNQTIKSPAFLARCLPKKAAKLCKKRPPQIKASHLTELELICELATESLALAPSLSKGLKSDIHLILFRMLDFWKDSIASEFSENSKVETWLLQFNEFIEMGIKYRGYQFSECLHAISRYNIRTTLAALLENFPLEVDGPKLSDALLIKLLNTLVSLKHPVDAELVWARRFVYTKPTTKLGEFLEFLALKIIDPNYSALQKQRLSAAAILIAEQCQEGNTFTLFATLNQLKLTQNWMTAEPGTQIVLAWQELSQEDQTTLLNYFKDLNKNNQLTVLLNPLNKALQEMEDRQDYFQKIGAMLTEFKKGWKATPAPQAYSGYALLNYFYSSAPPPVEDPSISLINKWEEDLLAALDNLSDEHDFKTMKLERVQKLVSEFLEPQLAALTSMLNEADLKNPQAYAYFEKLFDDFMIKKTAVNFINTPTITADLSPKSKQKHVIQ